MLNVVGCYAECLALGSFMVKSTLLLVSTRSYVITGPNKNWTEEKQRINMATVWPRKTFFATTKSAPKSKIK